MVKKKIHIVAPYPLGEAPSQRFRFEQYIEQLQDEDYEIVFHSFLTLKTWRTIYKEGYTLQKVIGIVGSFLNRIGLIMKLSRADNIFIHREVALLGPPIFEWILAKVLRKKYIYDFDDATWLPNYSDSNARFHRLKAYWKVKYCIKWAHQVTAGNAYLANYALQFNPHVKIIPTTIDTENYHNQTVDYNNKNISIGWTGTHTTLHYLDFIIPVLERLEKKYVFDFIVISNKRPDWNLKSLHFIQWSKETEIEDLLKIGIGIMPLQEDQWSVGKCGFKALQYMSLGIPTVLSPVGVNKDIVSHEENGLLAATALEWEQSLSELFESASLREKLGKKGQDTVLTKYSVKANFENYRNLFR